MPADVREHTGYHALALGGDIELIFDDDRAGSGEFRGGSFNLRRGLGNWHGRGRLSNSLSVRAAQNKQRQCRKYEDFFHFHLSPVSAE